MEDTGDSKRITTSVTEGPTGELVMNPKAYDMWHSIHSGWPCLSFDIVTDSLGFGRKKVPLECFLVGARQGENNNNCTVDLMHVQKMWRTRDDDGESEDDEEEEEADEEEEDEDDGENAVMFNKDFEHYATPNRIKANRIKTDQKIVAVWSSEGHVAAYNMSDLYQQLADPAGWIKSKAGGKMVLPPEGTQQLKPFFKSTHAQHKTEGYGLAWNNHQEGWLASGDCDGRLIHWDLGTVSPQTQHATGATTLKGGHPGGVEDIQWSPQQENILATCGCDGHVRIWDIRAPEPVKLTWKVDDYDVNVLAWNTHSGAQALLATGCDTGGFAVWDMRKVKGGQQAALASHAFHKEPITAIEWSPTSDSLLLVADYKEVGLWDLSAEKDAGEDSAYTPDAREIPAQLLFLHQGQEDLRDAHWHPQLPGLVITSDVRGLQFWRPHQWQKIVQ
eukprot:TRINITY_DN3062_c0_g1_i1.p1 TRINITY_DN3062_c0_g1~~TRINITY_DN3062_c0_g1_i1.p1  ORF type:complete len:518 (+),score=84.35 TRINITY_DN3062_c0_g1_i1:218-1555(+)